MSQTLDGLLHREYLSDGVYAGFDGYQMVFYTQEGMKIYADSYVWIAMVSYQARLAEKLAAARAAKIAEEKADGE